MLTPPNEDTVYSIIKALGREIWSSSPTPAGLLVALSTDGTSVVAAALRSSGYTVTKVASNTVMVGGVDHLVLLEAQIAALQTERDRLMAARLETEAVR
ncbi:hypothetical protein [Nocardiopsis sp. NRRL B-16309]|uniref:hypothetical protein n=1 Tax=Nocardiopsis sp. NRRL B-16309 TaxID=1519494 RepID=UPI0006B06378|nr:hypothetical protein [Nocardiopsis sp. NRRL B-16309]KOX18053.1 hypothetical protein ADL05_08030 [Nocardiopsis sp. NRRL B-16309]